MIDQIIKHLNTGAGNYPALRIPAAATTPIEISNLALILCHHGHDSQRVAAARRALAWTLQSRPLPSAIVMVEAAEAGADRYFAALPGVRYISRTIGDRSRGIWLKEALWTIGANAALEDSRIEGLVFVDVDCAFARQDWAAAVASALREHDVISPHSHMYYAEQDDGRKQIGRAHV